MFTHKPFDLAHLLLKVHRRSIKVLYSIFNWAVSDITSFDTYLLNTMYSVWIIFQLNSVLMAHVGKAPDVKHLNTNIDYIKCLQVTHVRSLHTSGCGQQQAAEAVESEPEPLSVFRTRENDPVSRPGFTRQNAYLQWNSS